MANGASSDSINREIYLSTIGTLSNYAQFVTQITYVAWLVQACIAIFGKRDLACIIKKHNKNALRLKCYNFRRVNAIVFLFSALHTTPFLYGKIHFGILNMLHASIAMSDTPRGSNPP